MRVIKHRAPKTRGAGKVVRVCIWNSGAMEQNSINARRFSSISVGGAGTGT